jgi:hypothetical protein
MSSHQRVRTVSSVLDVCVCLVSDKLLQYSLRSSVLRVNVFSYVYKMDMSLHNHFATCDLCESCTKCLQHCDLSRLMIQGSMP